MMTRTLENKQAESAARGRAETSSFTTPAVDVYENKDELLLFADLPGIKKDEVSIHLDKGQLSIEAKRAEPPSGAPLATEFRPLGFRRTFTVPRGIEADQVSADLNDGVLRVHLPKSPALKPRTIKVTAG